MRAARRSDATPVSRRKQWHVPEPFTATCDLPNSPALAACVVRDAADACNDELVAGFAIQIGSST